MVTKEYYEAVERVFERKGGKILAPYHGIEHGLLFHQFPNGFEDENFTYVRLRGGTAVNVSFSKIITQGYIGLDLQEVEKMVSELQSMADLLREIEEEMQTSDKMEASQ